MPLPIGLGFLMLPMALPRASFLVLPMALPRAIGFSSSGGPQQYLLRTLMPLKAFHKAPEWPSF